MATSLPVTTPEVRYPHWEDLRSLIFPGFLTARVRLGDHIVCVRSPSSSDIDYMRWVWGEGRSDWSDRLTLRSIWAIDGKVFLNPDAHQEAETYEIFKRFPELIQQTLFMVTLGLIIRSQQAYTMCFGFCMEPESRELWKSLGPPPYGRQDTGFETGCLGSNMVQRLWRAFNEGEDQRLDNQYAWLMCKQGMANELAFRDEVFQAHTAEELMEEMHRWVTGKEDRHDKAVSAYKQNIQEKMVREKAEREQRLELARREAEAAVAKMGWDPHRPSVVGYSLNQIQQMMVERGDNMEQPGIRKIAEGPSRRERAFDHWVHAEIKDGNLESDGDTLVEKRPQPKTPLQEQVRSRKPTAREDD